MHPYETALIAQVRADEMARVARHTPIDRLGVPPRNPRPLRRAVGAALVRVGGRLERGPVAAPCTPKVTAPLT